MKRTTPILAFVGAIALMTAAPALAQNAAPAPAAAAPADNSAVTAPAASPDASAASPDATPTHVGGAHAGHLGPWEMFIDAEPLVKVVMVGLVIASFFSWTILILKIFEFNSMNRVTNRFLETFRGAKSIADMGKIAEGEEFAGNPLADMAAAAAAEVELSRQAGLHVAGEHRDTTIMRAQSAVSAVQASLARRLSGGMQFLATVGSTGPFTPTRPTSRSWRPASPKRCWRRVWASSPPSRRWCSTTTSKARSPLTVRGRKASSPS
jgi:biopolymer transport protein ExbB